MIEPLPEGPNPDVDETIALLIVAMDDLFLVTFDYNGAHRSVAPYEVGWTEAGFAILVGYQFTGESLRGKVLGWKTFRVDYMEYLEISEEKFVTDPEREDMPAYWTKYSIHSI